MFKSNLFLYKSIRWEEMKKYLYRATMFKENSNPKFQNSFNCRNRFENISGYIMEGD